MIRTSARVAATSRQRRLLELPCCLCFRARYQVVIIPICMITRTFWASPTRWMPSLVGAETTSTTHRDHAVCGWTAMQSYALRRGKESRLSYSTSFANMKELPKRHLKQATSTHAIRTQTSSATPFLYRSCADQPRQGLKLRGANASAS